MPDLFINNPQLKETIPLGKHRPTLLSSYCENPDKVTFTEAEPDEEIILFLRRHFITNIPWIITTILLLFVPALLNLFLETFSVNISFLPTNSFLLLTIFYYLLVFAYGIVCYFTWFFNISLITQKRVIDIDFSDLVYKNVAATKMDLVQDASYTQVGVIRSVFNYGDVIIQTAGSMENFDLSAVPHPDKVIRLVENLIGGKERE